VLVINGPEVELDGRLRRMDERLDSDTLHLCP
jgi:hypothetical protein